MLIVWFASAWAGSIVVETDRPVDVRMKNLPLLKTYGAVKAELQGFDPGVYTLSVTVGEKTEQVEVTVADDQASRLVVGDESVVDKAGVRPPEAPVFTLRSVDGKGYGLIVGDARVAVVGGAHPVTFTGYAPGPLEVEIRSSAFEVVWYKGTLELEPADALGMGLREGKGLVLEGRTEAWKP